MNYRKHLLFFFTLITAILIMTGCSAGETNSTDEAQNNENKNEQPASSSELRIALNAQPASLDLPKFTEVATRDTAMLMFETLVTQDSDFKTVPMLAESIDMSEDGTVYTFHLREDVTFHNGKEMIAEDVIASMERWLEVSTLTGAIFEGSTWTAKDDYTVILELATPSALTLDTMASGKMAPAIMPKEMIESAPDDGVTEYVGTGPYQLVEWKQDQYIHFTKYEDYQPVESEANGASGKKEAIVDDIYFDIVTDSSTRLAGLQTGEYDIAYGISTDNSEQLTNDPNLELYTSESGGSTQTLFYNKTEGISTNPTFRQAINAALDMEEILLAAFTSADLFWLDSGYMNKNMSNWASDAGNEYYNQHDLEKTKKLLDEMGYDGEEVKLMTTRDYDQFYNIAVVIQDQLLNAGINVKLEVYDWATVTDNLYNRPEKWDIYTTAISPVSTPSQLLMLSRSLAGGLDEKATELLIAMESAPNQEEAKEKWDELQLYLWETYLPVTVIGGANSLYGVSNKVEGFTLNPHPIYWNVSVKD